MLIDLPDEIEAIYAAVRTLEKRYPGRKFTPDGHLVGSIGEVIAAEALELQLEPSSTKGYDAVDGAGRQVQIKLTGGKGISLNDNCERLVVMQIVSTKHARLVFDGRGDPVWRAAGKMQKNGQRRISFSKMQSLEGWLT